MSIGQARETYFHTKVLTKKQYRSMLRLLEIFGRHLAILSNQIAVGEARNVAVSKDLFLG